MNRKPDATKIEAALERAAHKALHGTHEERSGRFKNSQPGREGGLRETGKPVGRTAVGRISEA